MTDDESTAARGLRRLRVDRAREVAGELRERIVAGGFASGALPDERSLLAEYGVTRNALREALRLLSAEGLLVRRPGLGTRVAARKFEHSLDRLAGLAETLVEHGPVRNEVRAARRLLPEASVAARLAVEEAAEVVYVERLRWLGDDPLSLDETYLPLDIGEPLLSLDLGSRDIFALIEETTGIPLGTAELTVQAVNADAETAGLLGVESGAAMFAIDRLTRLSGGRPVDVEVIHLRGDRVTLNSLLHRSAGPDPYRT